MQQLCLASYIVHAPSSLASWIANDEVLARYNNEVPLSFL